MHITNQKSRFYIVMVGNLQNILIDHNLYLIFYNDVRHKIDNIDPYNVLLEIATNIPVQLKKTVFLVRGHICNYFVAGNVWMWLMHLTYICNYIFYIWSISYDDDICWYIVNLILYFLINSMLFKLCVCVHFKDVVWIMKVCLYWQKT